MSRATLLCALLAPSAVRALRPGLWRAPVPCACATRVRALRACALDGPFWTSLETEARDEAEALGLTIESFDFAGGKLSVLASGGSVDELQQLNSHLGQFIDNAADDEVDALPPFLLEVSSPGLGSQLTSDLDFSAFKGFPVTVTTTEVRQLTH
jgi:hypothetical protein